jgi:2,3-bisphosphoglycerate-dependent phosphoglycerate mutase
MLTKVYFVRHAQPVHSYADDRTRPLTEEGIVDSKLVLQTLKDKKIDVFYCSPYKRSLDTIRETADYYEMNIQTDERLREREAGADGNVRGMYQKRWANHNFHENGGESIGMVQQRNIEALKTILKENEGKNIAIGTHGTALSSIINYYLPEFGCDDFLRIIDWMPYIVEIDFEGQKFISIHEHAHTEKKLKKDNSANKQ